MDQPASFAQEPLQQKRVLRVAVVEDDANVREMFRRMVGKIPGLVCVGAFVTGEEAVRELPSLLPDLVLMDIHLPGINGIECMQQLRRSLPPVKVVMLTCERGHELLFTALRGGADGYATKPCERLVLARVIAETMAGGESHCVGYDDALGPGGPESTETSVVAASGIDQPGERGHAVVGGWDCEQGHC